MRPVELYEMLLGEAADGWQVSEHAVQLYDENLPSILALVNEKFRLEVSYAGDEVSSQNIDFLVDAHRHFGKMLLAVYHFQLWVSLIDETVWYAQSVRSRGLGESYLSQMLKTWMIALHSYVKPPEVNELNRPLAWLSSHARDFFQLGEQERVLSDKASELLNLLLRNERTEAEELVTLFSGEQRSPEAVINQIFISVLSEIGRLWRDNQISVADEHLAVANLRSIYRSYFRSIPPDEKKEQKIIVCCVPGEEHEAGPELLSLYLRIKGWDVTFVGHSAPEAEILRTVEQDTPFALLLSVTLIHNLPALVSLTQRLRERFPSMKILAGGNALRNAKKVVQEFVDGTPDSFEECHRMLDNMVNIHA